MRTRIEGAASLLGPPLVVFITLAIAEILMEKASIGFGFYKVKIVQPGSADPADIQRTKRLARTPDCAGLS
jgi:hypothetical protein